MDAAAPSPKKRRFGALFAPIRTQDDAEKALKEFSGAAYAVAALLGLLALAFALLGSVPRSGRAGLELIPEVSIWVAAGYFLPRRKSRTLAVAMLLLAVSELVVTLGNLSGGSGGKNIILALVIIFVCVRTVNAAWVYHREAKLVIRWGGVVLSLLVSLVAALLAAAVAAVIFYVAGVQNHLLGYFVAIPLFLIFIATLALMTRRWPFAMPPAAA